MRLAYLAGALMLVCCDGSVTRCGPLGRPLWRSQGPTFASAAAIGDVNGDGLTDLVLNVEDGSDDPTLQCYLNGPNGISAAPSWTTVSPSVVDDIVAGDVNHDGYDDVIASENFHRRTSVYLGSPAGLPDSPSMVLATGGPWRGTIHLEDVDCDGLPELIIGYPKLGYATAEAWKWRSGMLDLISRASCAGQGINRIAINAGDVNGDGCGDVLLMGQFAEPVSGRSFRPQVALHLGGPIGFSEKAAWVGEKPTVGIDPFDAVALGDVGHDGVGDVLIMSPSPSVSGNWQLRVFHGERFGALGSDPAWYVEISDRSSYVYETRKSWVGRVPPQLYEWTRAGDFNGDGVVDVFLRMGLYLGNGQEAPGPFDGAEPVFKLDGRTPAAVGDVNNDGCDDFLDLYDDGATLYSGGTPESE